MHSFLERQHFGKGSHSDLESNAHLALHLALHLQADQQSYAGYWPGNYLSSKLRYTCHAVEALHLIGWSPFNVPVDAGVHWLINLADSIDPQEEEPQTALLHPSRFKTLIHLKHFFATPELQNEFVMLCNKVWGGLLCGVLSNPLLATIVLADCFYVLEQETNLMTPWQSIQTTLLDTLQRELTLWTQPSASQVQNLLIDNIGDASYALDILLRTRRITKDDPISYVVYEHMINHIQSPAVMPSHRMDSFYCVIQLATHFRNQPETPKAMATFFHKVRSGYDRGEISNGKSTPYAHALVLRALLTGYGDDLRNCMMELLLKDKVNGLAQRHSSQERQRKQVFQAVIQDRTNIHIKNYTLLTGGITKAEVFRVEYELGVQPLVDEPETMRARLTSPPVVIKCGSLDEIQHAIDRYRRLPLEIRPYFAQHSGAPKILEASAGAPAYLVLEDLTEKYHTLHSIFDNIDQLYLSTELENKLVQLCTATTRNLFEIYRFTRKPAEGFMGNQFYRLYMRRLEDELTKICRPEAFPRLKTWYQCCRLGDKRFASIEYYLQQINQHRSKLAIPCLVLAHGDCHSRNLMLDDSLTQIKLIDLDKLEYSGDYILDLAKLIEDVALFRFLFDERHRRYLPNEQIQLPMSADPSANGENRIVYPPLTSGAIQQFQTHMLQHLEQFANEISDSCWKERLWLGSAICLLALVDKQPNVQHALVLYVEAIKLLDELVNHLNGLAALSAIPFPGQHPGVERVDKDHPFTNPHLPILNELHADLLKLGDEFHQPIEVRPKLSGGTIRYHIGHQEQPFAYIVEQKERALLYLDGDRAQLDDPKGVLELSKSTGAFKAFVAIHQQTPLNAVLQLVEQVLKLKITGLEPGERRWFAFGEPD